MSKSKINFKKIDKHLNNKIVLATLVGLLSFISLLTVFNVGLVIGRSVSYMDFTSTWKNNLSYSTSVMDSTTPFQYYTETDSQTIHYDKNNTYVVDVLSKSGYITILEYNSKDRVTDAWELDYFSLGVQVYDQYNWKKIYEKDADGKKVYTHQEESSRTFRYGGIYFGDKYNYVALAGQRIGWFTDELSQNSIFFSPLKKVVDAPAYRIIKYSKNFKQLDYVDIPYGVQNKVDENDVTNDIARPLGFATLVMAESTDGSTLIVSTGKEGYDDGSTHHQTALQFVIDVKSFESTNGIRQNWVSHSLNQYVVYDNDTIVYCDLSDASPHGIKMYLTSPTGRILLSNIHNTPVIGGYYFMHMNLGGVAVGEESYVIAYNTMDVTSTNTTTRNIMISTVNRENQSTNQYMIEEYNNTANKGGQPYIVPMKNDNFAIMWHEYTSGGAYLSTCYAVVNSKGETIINTTRTNEFVLNRYACPVYIEKEDVIKWTVDSTKTDSDGIKYNDRTFYRLELEV